jgi:23S rRNA (uridine2552-2'-O)-methyltransferase
MPGDPKGKSRRSKSSDRWLREHFADPFVRAARASGWRSRAVFKLEEIDRRERLLKVGAVCLDLGAAPGAWSQYARGRVGVRGRVIASDILPMAEVPGVEFVQGDFREAGVFERILELLADGRADVVLSDMAPPLSGVDAIDQPRAMHLAELALDMGARILKPGGAALIKVFQGSGFEELVRAARGEFGTVKLVKPVASRSRSPEIYLLAMQFRLV